MTVDELRHKLASVPGTHKVLVSLTKDGYESVDVIDTSKMRLTESIPEGDYDLYEPKNGDDNALVLFIDGAQ
jgi:hypothetical protein